MKNENSSHWAQLSAAIVESFRLSADEAKRLSESKIARLIAELPFIAGCDECERTALAHLSVYLMASKGGKPWFNHAKSDNISPLARLRLGTSFVGGNKGIIDRGMNILALAMLSDYDRDRDTDRAAGKYNPLSAGDWDFGSLKAELRAKLASNPSEEMDQIITEDQIVNSSWI